jgi:hypothetical protein
MNSELACGEFIKPHGESGNEKVACGLKRFLAPNRSTKKEGRDKSPPSFLVEVAGL